MAVVAIIVNAAVGLVGVGVGAFATAHNPPIAQALGATPVITVTASPRTGLHSDGAHKQIGGLPSTAAFTRGSITITFQGTDLDRNPPEAGGVTSGSIDVSANGGTLPSLLFGDSLEVVQWKQQQIPNQAQCHYDELTNGESHFSFDLTSAQQSRTVVSFCILTSESRDAYLVIHGSQVATSQSIPADVFVWPRKISVS